jgi:hypothetical protein
MILIHFSSITMNVFRIFLNITLLKAKPQDVPFSWQLLAITAATSIVAYVFALKPATPELARILGTQSSIVTMSLAEHAFFAITVWVILKLRGYAERFVQAMTAMFAVSTVIRLIVWLVVALLASSKEPSGAGLAGTLVFGISVWMWIVYAHIFRETLETRFGAGLLYTIVSQVVTSMLLLTVIDIKLQ